MHSDALLSAEDDQDDQGDEYIPEDTEDTPAPPGDKVLIPEVMEDTPTPEAETVNVGVQQRGADAVGVADLSSGKKDALDL